MRKLIILTLLILVNIINGYSQTNTYWCIYETDNNYFRANSVGTGFSIDASIVNAKSIANQDLVEQIRNYYNFSDREFIKRISGNNCKTICQKITMTRNKIYNTYYAIEIEKSFVKNEIIKNGQSQSENEEEFNNGSKQGNDTYKTNDIVLSDVDCNIPSSSQSRNNTFVVIIANENYSKEVNVEFAKNDGEIFKEYCEKTIGIPSKNIHLVQDATYGTLKSELNWIAAVADVYKGEAELIFYYAGHGMPNEKDKSSYLLPVDGSSSDVETAIKIEELYNRLGEYPTKNVTVILDACFSGSIRNDGMLSNARGVRIQPKEELLKGNMVVLSAATGDETAYPYEEKQHGLFTYFLLKKLQETKGDVDLKTLSNYIVDNVSKHSIVINNKLQTPQIKVSNNIQGSLENKKF